MTYEVNAAGRANPVPGTEAPEDDEPEPVTAAGIIAGLTSLEDMTLPGTIRRTEDWRRPWGTGCHPEWTDGDR